AGEWRDRLEQISKVLGHIRDRAPRLADGASIPSQAGVVDTTRPEETLEEWLRRQVDLHGYAAVRASHLVEDHPTILVRSIVAGGVRRGLEDDRRYDVYLDSVSSSPRLVDAPPSLRIRETRDELVVAVELASLSSRGGDDRFDLVIRNLPTEDISRQLVNSDTPPFSGGRLNITAGGVVMLGPTIAIAAPIDVELLDSTIRLGGEAATIPRLRVRLDVGGSLADPEVAIDEDLLAESLREAGHAVLAEKAKSEAGKHLDDGLQRIEEEAGIDIPDDLRKGIGDAIGGGIGELFGGGKKP
ncbi:MAG: hypothetical protein GY895_18440, partial [Phycisphaera sp.]|nr:hypothetical protein [Phycisphaera sp.]